MLAGLSCEECHTHFYEIPSGLPSTYEGKGGLPVLQDRPENSPPPCEKCPKSVNGGPDFDGIYILSDENYQLLELCQRASVPGYQLPPHLIGDPFFAERYAVVREIRRECEMIDNSERLQVGLAKIILRS